VKTASPPAYHILARPPAQAVGALFNSIWDGIPQRFFFILLPAALRQRKAMQIVVFQKVEHDKSSRKVSL
jgi:hypothetical protein